MQRFPRSLLGLALALELALVSGCASGPTAEEKAMDDIRDTTVIPNLGSYDDQVQTDAVQRMLGVLDSAPEVGKNLLVATLRDPVTDERTKMVCAWLLSTVDDRRALPALMEFLGQGADATDDLVREAVVSYGASVIPSVSAVLEGGNDLARLTAAEILTDLEIREGFDALADRLPREPQARVRFMILCGLSSDRSSTSTEALELALLDEDSENREQAWNTLAKRFKVPPSLSFDSTGTGVRRAFQVAAYHQWRKSQ